MTVDPFTSASPTYIAAQRTNQAKGNGYDFRMESIVDRSPLWIRTIELLFRPSTIFSLSLLSLMVWLLINYRGGLWE